MVVLKIGNGHIKFVTGECENMKELPEGSPPNARIMDIVEIVWSVFFSAANKL
jgi:hypothetical protein